jgi:hypothetical protein
MFLKTIYITKLLRRLLVIAFVPVLFSCQKDVTIKVINDGNLTSSFGGLLGNWSLYKIKEVEMSYSGATLKQDSIDFDFERSEKLLIKQDYLTISEVSTPYTIEGTKDDASIKYLRQYEYVVLNIKFLGKSDMILERKETIDKIKKSSYLYFKRF